MIRNGLDSLVILGSWVIWNHRNRCVFDGATPSIAEALILAGEERQWRLMAGARGLSPDCPAVGCSLARSWRKQNLICKSGVCLVLWVHACVECGGCLCV
ncbi:hypothetical protein PR202_gb16093 [Eleusine coracana subsp. coracana]|uniref:Uncharacterized protein n=1 Tax=Eleusine coracana subsp. coracana TaxID=191504 RepID=A0AAV5EXA0_ELECO|nr:hypothetical protein PR202_gb16093 [Eleusine coracana subsp. coracana]